MKRYVREPNSSSNGDYWKSKKRYMRNHNKIGERKKTWR